MKRVWKRIFLAAGIMCALDCAAVGTFFSIGGGALLCLFRQKERQKERAAQEDSTGGGRVELNERSEGIRWIEGMHCESVHIKSEDGLRLTGYYLEAEKVERIVVMFHGWRGSWRHDFGACLKWLYEENSSLLLVEQRAQGESEGKYMGFGLLERRDWQDMVKLAGRKEYQPPSGLSLRRIHGCSNRTDGGRGEAAGRDKRGNC